MAEQSVFFDGKIDEYLVENVEIQAKFETKILQERREVCIFYGGKKYFSVEQFAKELQIGEEPSVEFNQKGIVYRGGLYEFVQIKPNFRPKYVVFARPVTKKGAETLKKIADIVDKHAAVFAFCVEGVDCEDDIQQRRFLSTKTVVRAERDIMDQLNLEDEIYIEGIPRSEQGWIKAVEGAIATGL